MSEAVADHRVSLQAAHDTERYLLAPICEVEHHGAYSVYRSREFSGFYSGNLLELHDARAFDLDGWQRQYQAHFNQSDFAHESIVGLHGSGIETLLPQAEARGLDISREIYLVADTPLTPPPLARDLCIRRVDSEQRWRMMRAFSDHTDRAEPWYTPAASAMLADKTRRISDALGLDWFYVSPRAEDVMLARLGLYEYRGSHGRAARLQDVVTDAAHRRRGLATALVAEAQRVALVERQLDALYVCADADYLALAMYRKQGFLDVGALIKLFRMR